MNDKKNIDQLFQEKFKDFEAEPNKQVWLNIEAELKEKERKIIPFWIKFSGIAAAFILGLFTLNMVFNSNIESNKTIVSGIKNTIENNDSISTKKEDNNTPFPIKNKQQVVITSPKTVRNHEKENTTFTSSETITEQEKNQNDTPFYKSKNNSSIKSVAFKNNLKSDSFAREANGFKNRNTPLLNSDGIIGDFKSESGAESKIAESDAKKPAENIPETPNELEEILKKKEEEKSKVAIANLNKWQIVPNVAAVYLNSNSGGSSIDPQFSENQKTADNSLSFGVGLNYAISKKITVRTGINKLALGYNTNDVIYSSGLVTNNLVNINYSSNEPLEIMNEASLNTLVNFEKGLQSTNTGVINQKMGYYEVPLELSYAIVNKKFGINFIGGISTLFLNQNKISLVSNTINLKLGEANNLNPIHFSTNIGMGFKYQFIKSFQVNFEPMLKYQLNTYSKNSGNYNPVFIGLYSGIIYTF